MSLSTLKSIARKTMSLTGRHRWPDSFPGMAGKLVILAYHRILPVSDPRYATTQPPMVVTPESLDMNLALASRYFRFIKLSEWLDATAKGIKLKGKYCAVTFDDGWIDNLQYALPVLRKYNVPATIYCVSNMIDKQSDYWPGLVTRLLIEIDKQTGTSEFNSIKALDWLNKACDKAGIQPATQGTINFDQVIESLKIYRDLEICEFIENTRAQLKLDYQSERQLLNSSELKSLLEEGLIEVGSHTVNHIRLSTATPQDQLEYEIVDSRTQLETLLDTRVNSFCYPNGYHPEASIKLAAQAYSGACTLEKGWNDPSGDKARLRRTSMHEYIASNPASFEASISGWI